MAIFSGPGETGFGDTGGRSEVDDGFFVVGGLELEDVRRVGEMSADMNGQQDYETHAKRK